MTAGESDEEAITEINVTPLVDVSLVLVIIFMAVAPFVLQAGIPVSSPKAGRALGLAAESENVTVTLSADGALSVSGEKTDWSNLAEVLRRRIAKSKDRLVMVSAEDENLVGQVVEIMDTAKQNGAQKIAILRK